MKEIEKIILQNTINSRIFSLGKDVYIVGGYLRDILAGKESKDIDYIVRGDIKALARELSARESGRGKVQKLLDGASVVELKKEHMVRIVLRDGSTLDFTSLKGGLDDNLRERDFTMNSLAWSPRNGLIDLFDGKGDIRGKKIRAISADNFMNDPLRLLRVYRFVSELGWDADTKTRKMVKTLKSEIKRSAPERITAEFFKLLDSKNYQAALKMAFDDGLMEHFLSISGKKLSENIRALPLLESGIKKIPTRYGGSLGKPFSQDLTLRGLLRLEKLLDGPGPGASRLRMSRLIRDRLAVVHGLLSEFEKHDILAKDALFDTFAKAEDAAFDFLVLTGKIKLLDDMERFNRILKKSFLTSEEIMRITGLKSGVTLGDLIRRLKKMEFEGRLKTKKEAVNWLNGRLFH